MLTRAEVERLRERLALLQQAGVTDASQRQAIAVLDDWLAMERLLRKLTARADVVMCVLYSEGPKIVPHLIDTDENAGQFLRETIAEARALLGKE